jgi:hypothetical protein
MHLCELLRGESILGSPDKEMGGSTYCTVDIRRVGTQIKIEVHLLDCRHHDVGSTDEMRLPIVL